MRSILANKLAFAITALIFTLVLGCNAVLGGGIVLPAHTCNLVPPAEVIHTAHGPTLPPDPWTPSSGQVMTAHGPTLPPDPWTPSSGQVMTAHGPTLPPDPWTPSSGQVVIS